MDPIYSNEKSEKSDNPPTYQANMGQGVAPQGVYPPVQGYGATPYGAQPYPGQGGVTVQPTMFVTPAIQVNPVPDYLAYSIFTMVCCCLPLGIAALIYSINTRDANLTGNRDMALRHSRTSRLLNNIALGLGIVSIIIVIIIVAVSASTAAASIHHFN
ncbi:synapse differentiation-inducing gene protein 1 [Ictalurus punctatus]|uniref:Synapse differentiation-inducing gene protein 1 n=1 Tax=Ictalurus punctatus TaxID=7998 RepID=A0A2D0PVD5_ICTPU|nr:synapse differentiation-inducing gene protein 1 [Ictalurus punctatus]